MTYRQSCYRRRRSDVGSTDLETRLWLLGGAEWRAAGSPWPWAALMPFDLPGVLERAWEDIAEEVLSRWIEQAPGTRPRGWWLFASAEPYRRRLGGIGVPFVLSPAMAHQQRMHPLIGRVESGIPVYWHSLGQVRAGICEGPAPSPEAPPQFESEPAFLRRHKMLGQEEAACLRPGDYQPITIVINDSGVWVSHVRR